MKAIERLLGVMATLRDPQAGCPWDIEQTPQSLIPHTLEEAHEVAHAIENESWHEVKSELGDLLFQVVFYAQIYKEQNTFDFNDVADAISEKIIRRHPHVFSDHPRPVTEQEQQLMWQKIKAEEKAAVKTQQVNSLLDQVKTHQPALKQAMSIQKQAAKVGFDWQDINDVLMKIEEELGEVREELETPARDGLEHELGDVLFAVVNLVRHGGFEPETVLRKANQRFRQRFALMEQTIERDGKAFDALSEQAWEAYWQEAKKREKQSKDNSVKSESHD